MRASVTITLNAVDGNVSASCKIHINAPLAGVGESDKKAQKRTCGDDGSIRIRRS